MSKAVIIADGEIRTDYGFSLAPGDFVICADGGYNNALKLGITPNVVIGDFDSLKGEMPKGVETLKYPSEKDETDTHLAVLLALSRGFRDIILVGAMGGRADHSLANICLLKAIVDNGANGLIIDGKNRFMVINKRTCVKKEDGYVSILPLFGEAKGVSLYGFKYKLDNVILAAGAVVGISNEIVDDSAIIDIKSGYLLVVWSRD